MAKDKEEGESEADGFTSIAGLLAQADREQRVAALADWATTLRDYYDSLVGAGFSADAALELTVAFQSDSLGRCEM